MQNELDLLNKVYPSERVRFQLAEEAKEKRKDWLRNLDTRDVVRLNLDLQIERMNLLLEDDGYEEGVEFNAKEVDAKREAARKAAQEAGEEASIRLEQLDNSSPDIIVDGSTLLQDVINGHYTMGDIAIAQGSAGNQDPIERSALQLFDNIVQYSKKHTRNILQSNDPRQFFQSLQQSGIDIQNMRP